MNVYEAIANRYSVRAYLPKPLEQDKLERILDAARLAPSACNRQAWKFIVVRDAKVRQALAEAAEQPFLAQAPVIVAIVGLEPKAMMHCGVPTDPVNCAIAMEHMALAATAEGLGCCWIGHFQQDSCCRILGVPQTAEVIELMPIGYAADAPRPKLRKALQEIVTYDKFE